MELRKIKTIVARLLKENEGLRGNDDLFYLEVLRKTHPYWNSGRITTNIENMPIGEFFSERKNMKMPSFESVRRSRAKIMEEHPELKPCEKVQKGREVQREKYCDMATNWKGLQIKAKGGLI